MRHDRAVSLMLPALLSALACTQDPQVPLNESTTARQESVPSDAGPVSAGPDHGGPAANVQSMLLVTLEGGGSYEVHSWEFARYDHSGIFYTQGDEYDVDYVPLHYQSAALVQLQITTVRQLDFDPEGGQNPVTVTLTDATTLAGLLRAPDMGQDHEVVSIVGRTTSEGYPASVSVPTETIRRIVFSQGPGDGIVGSMILRDGTSRTDVHDVKFRLAGTDSRSHTTPSQTLHFQKGDTTLEIPFTDVARLTWKQMWGAPILHLRTGSGLTGGIEGGYVLHGTTTAFGEKVPFEIDLGGLVGSIEFQ